MKKEINQQLLKRFQKLGNGIDEKLGVKKLETAKIEEKPYLNRLNQKIV